MTNNLPPAVMRVVMRQIAKLAKSPPFGVRFKPHDDDNYSEIYAEIEGPAETPFAGGSFKVKLVIDSSYPLSPPRGYFLTKIFHPNVSTTGEICVNALKKDWEPKMGLAHVLKVIWCLLLVPFPESSLNDDAGRLFMESYEDYCKKAAMMTRIYAIGHGSSNSSTGGNSSSSSGGGSSSSSSSSTDSPQISSSIVAGVSAESHDTSPPKSLKSKSPNRPPFGLPKKRGSRSKSKANSPVHGGAEKRVRKDSVIGAGNELGSGSTGSSSSSSSSSSLSTTDSNTATTTTPVTNGIVCGLQENQSICLADNARSGRTHGKSPMKHLKGKKSHGRRKSLQRL